MHTCKISEPEKWNKPTLESISIGEKVYNKDDIEIAFPDGIIGIIRNDTMLTVDNIEQDKYMMSLNDGRQFEGVSRNQLATQRERKKAVLNHYILGCGLITVLSLILTMLISTEFMSGLGLIISNNEEVDTIINRIVSTMEENKEAIDNVTEQIDKASIIKGTMLLVEFFKITSAFKAMELLVCILLSGFTIMNGCKMAYGICIYFSKKSQECVTPKAYAKLYYHNKTQIFRRIKK